MQLFRLLLMPVPLALICSLLMLCTVWQGVLPVARWSPSDLRLLFGLSLVILAALICVAAVHSFRQAQTTVDPRAPQQASQIVRGGIFAYSRNPMYLGFSLALFGWSLMLAAPLTFVWVAVYICYLDRVQIPYEELALEQKFGAAYLTYCQQVRRWF